MSCPGGTTLVGTAYGTPFCVSNGWCTWYPFDSTVSRVQHVYDQCKNNTTGAITLVYNHTLDLNQCC